MPLNPGQMNEVKTFLRSASVEQLHEIATFAKNVRTQHAHSLMGTIQPGDSVRLDGLRPKYINGTVVKVIRVNNTRLVVENPTMRRGEIVTVPASCCTKVAA